MNAYLLKNKSRHFKSFYCWEDFVLLHCIVQFDQSGCIFWMSYVDIFPWIFRSHNWFCRNITIFQCTLTMYRHMLYAVYIYTLYIHIKKKKNQSLLPIFGRKVIRTCSKKWWIHMKREDTGRPVLLSASINSCYAALTCICLSCMLKLIVTKTCSGQVTPPCPSRCYREVNAFWGFWSIDDGDNIIIIRAQKCTTYAYIHWKLNNHI